MGYQVRRLEKREDIVLCPVCPIDSFNWGGNYRPAAFGQLGLLPKQNLFVHMWAREADPVAVCVQNQDPVYLDSALEFFIQSSPKDEYYNKDYYNFEINSLGAMLAQKGADKANRVFLTDNMMSQLDCQVKREQSCWHVYLTLPLALLSEGSIKSFRFNFYKIKESSGNTHFASYAPIIWDSPNFHLPQFFASAVLEED